MAKITHLLQPLRKAAQAFFVSEVTLRRDEGGLRVALEERRPAGEPRPLSAAEQAAERQRRELELMLGQLAEVLDELPETRATLRHLVFVEHALNKRGLRALKKMPLEVLRRGLEQFEGLVTNWSPVGLAALRSKMAVAVIERENDDDVTTESGALDSVFAPDRVEAVLMEPPKVQAGRAIAEAKEAAFADSTIERLALEFGVAPPAPGAQVEVQGELRRGDARRGIEVRKLHV